MRRNFDYHSILGESNPLWRYPQLLEAAIDEFARKKYDDASLNDILRHSRMSKGSLYYHFGDKFGLYLAMMDIIIKRKMSYFYPVLHQEVDASDFFSILRGVVKASMEFMLSDERMHCLSSRVMEESEEFRDRVFGFFVHDYSQFLSAFIGQAMESGQVDDRYPPEFVARAIEIMLANLHKLAPGGDPDTLLNAADRVVDLIQHGISSR